MKLKYKHMMFNTPDNDNAGGGSPLDTLNDAPEIATPETTAPVAEAPETTANPPAVPAFDHDRFAAAIAAGLKQAAPPVQQQAPQLTPEQARKQLNVWEPDDAFIQKFGDLATQKAAIADMRDYFIRQSDTITQLRLQEMQQKFNEQFAPIQQHIQEQAAVARETRFNTQFPTLAKPELRPILSAVIQGLGQQGQLTGDEKTIFTKIAAAVNAVVPQLTPGGSTPAGKPTGRGLAPTTSGAGGGGGGNPAPANGNTSKFAQVMGS